MSVWRIGTIARDGRAVTVIEVGGEVHPLGELLERSAAPAPETPIGVRDLLDAWGSWRPVLRRLAGELEGAEGLAREPLEWLPAIPDPRKIVCVGVNYSDHLAEMGSEKARQGWPFAFVKPQNTLLGHGRTLTLPAMAHKVDWEAELAVVIGRRAHAVSREDALGVVAGYCPFNDVSARDWIPRAVPGVGLDWILHKSFDGFGPLGPLITPADFVPDPQDLAIRLTVNDVVKQESTTAKMIFGVREIVAHLSSVMTLLPGDVIATGTPSGVGHGRGEYLQDGDRVVVSIAGLGELVTPVER